MKNDIFMGAFEIYYDITGRKEQLEKLLSTSSVAIFVLAISLMSGIIIALIKAGKNIENRKRAEEALKETNEHMEDLLFSLPTGIVIIDSETREIIDVNPQAVLMIGAPQEQIVGLKCHQFICPAEEGRCPVGDLGQTINRSERMLVTACGEKVPIFKSVIPLTLNDRECFIECFVDISEHKLAEQERIQKEKLQGVFEMAGAVCHEFNQPLQVVSGISELMLMHVKDDNPLNEKIKTIKEQIARMGIITKKLMGVTEYKTKDYLKSKIIDIDQASA